MKIFKRAAVVLLVLALPAACGVGWVVTGAFTGCSLRDANLSGDLEEDPILNAAALPGSTRVGDPYSGCDEDDGFAYAGRGYDHPGNRADLVAHYRAAAVENGWQLHLDEEDGGG
ncbi:hypothetical protein [Kitasatospora sp. NPDC094015]|uniref:hypothetical protein n=1 Tax=Kitasatospora sp. NPDC094015 TaxID=3155205 RepID=UPI003317A4A4